MAGGGRRLARVTAIHTLDDITGEPARETVFFALDGVSYEIDLTAEHADDLRGILRPYVEHGRRTGGRRRKRKLVKGPTPIRRASARLRSESVERGKATESDSEQPTRAARRSRRGASTRRNTTTTLTPRPTRRRPARNTEATAPSPVPAVTFSAPAS